ncbi:amidohydrolase family protein [Microbacterium sp. WCS2018Hpa-23]|uniref:amidohydrolase family protein n=1 Tax=Microbacterium sp. WCS2018Hpa-23 TaxID=3073634 RepID=UPI002882EBD8|nr:amidohydrolase family protein [Microbacterium sp. WCS2018Hpa-23]
MHAATFFDGEGWRDGILELVDGRMLLSDATPAHDLPRLDGVIVGGFTDHHVHLQLVDRTLLHGSALGRVIDLGANPTVIAAYADAARFVSVAGAPSLNERQDAAPRPHNQQHDTVPRSLSERSQTKRPHPVAVEFAGAFLTPVGGYPSDRDWAPEGSFREIAASAAADSAVAEMADAGASCIKVASNADAGPVFTDDLFRAIVDAASARGLPVVAHAQGSGEAQRVARLGAARLAHAPFTERLEDAEIATQAASVAWISTLSIHDGGTPDERDTLATVVDNVRRFHAAGGTVLYGTDMGNGPTPVGLNPNELAALRDAGITGTALLRALAPQDPRDTESTLFRLPGTDADPALARPLTSADLKAMT